MLSTVKPCLRVSRPWPPPSDSPPTPVCEIAPPTPASLNSCALRSKSHQVAPPSTRAVRRSGSTRTPRSWPRSMTRSPSAVEWPAALCPPPRMAGVQPPSRAKVTAAATSAGVAGRMTSAGRKPANLAFHRKLP